MRRSGFTLIELMIVLAIIAALAAILTPMGINALNRAKATQYVSDVRNLRSAAQIIYFDKTAAPDEWSDFAGYLTTGDLTLKADDFYKISDSTTNQFVIEVLSISDGVKAQMENAWTGTGWNSSDKKFTFDLSQ